MLKKLSVAIGLTETEIKVLLFLLSTFVIGFGYKTLIKDEAYTQREFDYSREDSLFFAAGDETELPEDSLERDKSVDYKQEVLDFNRSSFSKNPENILPAEKSININSAGIKDLMLLPGIGERTAERIIELRNSRGKIKSLNELLDVKGIGEAKYQNIRKYLFVE